MQHSVKAQKQAKDYKFVMNARRHSHVFPRIRQWLLPHFTFLLEAVKCLLKTPLLDVTFSSSQNEKCQQLTTVNLRLQSFRGNYRSINNFITGKILFLLFSIVLNVSSE